MVSRSGNQPVGMSSRDTKRQIKEAIVELTPTETPVCTAEDIAEATGLSKVTVNNHIQSVLDQNPLIEQKMAGQTPVYYAPKASWEHLPDGEDVKGVGNVNLSPSQPARLYQLVDAGEDSEFDLLVRWFDAQGDELEDYEPTINEIGEVAAPKAADPVAIKFREKKPSVTVENEEEHLPPGHSDIDVEVGEDA